MKNFFLGLLFMMSNVLCGDPLDLVPVSYQGRILPFKVYAQQWIQQFNRQAPEPVETLLQLHFEGREHFDQKPFFEIRDTSLLSGLKISDSPNHLYSYREIMKAIETEFPTVIYPILLREYRSEGIEDSEKKELRSLARGLWIRRKGKSILIMKTPEQFPWNLIPKDAIIFSGSEDDLSLYLKKHDKLRQSGKTLLQQLQLYVLDVPNRLVPIFPHKHLNEVWLPIGSLSQQDLSTKYHKARETLDKLYPQLKEAYQQGRRDEIALIKEEMADAFLHDYEEYRKSTSSSEFLPSLYQLRAEIFYQEYPWALILLCTYSLGTVFYCLNRKLLTSLFITLGWSLHCCLLALRTYILERPPVSNMYETVLYVPFISLTFAALLTLYTRKRDLLFGGLLSGIVLCGLLYWTALDGYLNTVQAVLNSTYWLTIHVLMVVGSYGIFALSALLGHLYLIRKHSISSQSILYTLYSATFFLITGTILGGVWAAQSWGRFWDWDPKESWAFISSILYLLIIHGYRYGIINDRGLAIGSIIGMMAISFTWYGVNYILGTGLHSYGFGEGGQIFYYVYLLLECLFLISTNLYFGFYSKGDRKILAYTEHTSKINF
ncbi:MAG: hypothetical protein Tsb0021_04320 [Chlamydiales bacterium]